MKKYLLYILAAFASLAVLTFCDDDTDESLGSSVSVSVDALSFEGTGATAQTIVVTANGDWVAAYPSWVSVSPSSGKWGETAVTISASDNTEEVTDDDGNTVTELAAARTGTVTFEGTDTYASVAIDQEGDPDKEIAAAEHVTIAEFCEKEDDSSVYWEITGTVTSIVNTTYGNMYLQDETGSVYIYGTLDWDGNTKNFTSLGLAVGDEFTCYGYKTTYNSIVEMVNAMPVEIVKSLVSTDVTSVEVAAEGESFTITAEYSGDDIAVSIPEDDSWLSMSGASVADGEATFTFTAAANTSEERSTTITFATTSDGTEYTSLVEVTQAAGGGDDSSSGDYTFTLASSVTSGSQYVLVVGSTVATPLSSSYGYLYTEDVTISSNSLTQSSLDNAFTFTSVSGGYTITDADGYYYYQSGTYNSFNRSSDVPSSGYVWSVTFQSDGTAEIMNNDMSKWIQYSSSYSSYGSYSSEQGTMPYLYEYTGGGSSSFEASGTGTEDDPYNVTAALEIINAGTYTSDEVYVTGTISSISEISTSYGNATYFLSDDGSTSSDQLEVYRGYSLNGDKFTSSDEIEVGDVLVVKGVLTMYGSTPEITTGSSIISINGGSSSGGDEGSEGIKTVTIAEFLAASESSTQQYQLTGKVASIRSSKYGNLYLKDDTGTVYVYGITATELAYGATSDQSFESLGVNVGDELTIVGYRYSYSGTDEAAYCYYVSHTPEEEDSNIYEVTIAEFLAASESSQKRYKMTGTITSIVSYQYGNFYMEDSTGSAYIFGLTATELGYGETNDESFADLGISVGDEVTLIGYRGSYGTTDEALYSYYVSHTEGSGSSGTDTYTSSISWTLVNNAQDGTSTSSYGYDVAQRGYINGTYVDNLLKLGNKTYQGYATFTIPAGTTAFTLYAVGWNDTSGMSLVITDSDGTTVSSNALTANDGATGEPPYTLTVSSSTDKFTVDLSSLDTSSDITLSVTSSAVGRVLIFGVNAVE